MRYYSTTAIRGYADNSSSQGFVDQIATAAALTSQKSGAFMVFKLGGLVITEDPVISNVSVADASARGGDFEKAIVLSNYDSAPTLTATPDGTVITSASVKDITTEGATVTYTLAANYSGAAKEGTITIKDADGTTGTITVNQVADVFSVARTELSLNAASGSTTTVTVKSDYDWTVVDDLIDGFTVSPTSFTYSGNQSQTVTITATGANSTAAAVELGVFTIKRSGDNKETSTITVSQASAKLASPVITLNGDSANKKFTVSWTSVPNASKYEYYVLDGNADYKVAVSQTEDASTTSFEVTDINLGETYQVSVKAIGNNSPWIDSDETDDEITVKAGSTTETISLAGTTIWDSYDDNGATLTNDIFTFVIEKNNSSTKVSQGITSEHTRLYSGSKVTITPASGKKISKLVFTVGENKYASPLASSTWTNASATASAPSVTVSVSTPGNAIVVTMTAQSRVTSVDVTYE